MSGRVVIGEFSVMTNLSRKALRIYHDLGLLQPAYVDPSTGYRYYDTSQVAEAQIIRRFRDLSMSVADIKAVLATEDIDARNAIIGAHLDRMESQLHATTAAVVALRALLSPTSGSQAIEIRHEPSVTAWAISSEVFVDDIGQWFTAALSRLRAALNIAGAASTGPVGGLYERELFADSYGKATLYVPVVAAASGDNVTQTVIPEADVAVITHHGSHDDIDRAYGALGTYVADKLIGSPGPIRERYLDLDSEPVAGRTEISWPIFQTAAVKRQPNDALA